MAIPAKSDLEAIERELLALTEGGNWSLRGAIPANGTWVVDADPDGPWPPIVAMGIHEYRDASFIAHAPATVKKMAAEIKALRAALERYALQDNGCLHWGAVCKEEWRLDCCCVHCQAMTALGKPRHEEKA